MVRGSEVGVRSIWWNVEKERQDIINNIKSIKMMNKFWSYLCHNTKLNQGHRCTTNKNPIGGQINSIL